MEGRETSVLGRWYVMEGFQEVDIKAIHEVVKQQQLIQSLSDVINTLKLWRSWCSG